MNITEEKIDSLNSRLKVSLSPDDYKPHVDAAIRKYKKKMNMPGFRPGMVPDNLVRKMYGKSVLAEELNRLVSESVDKYINDNKLAILGNPLPDQANDLEDLEKEGDFEFSFDMGLAPEFQLNLPPAHTFTRYEIQVSDQDVTDEAEKVYRRNGEFIQPEKIDSDCSVYGTLTELDQSGQVLNGGVSNQAFLMISKLSDSKGFIGLQSGDTVVFNPSQTISLPEEARYLLGLKEGQTIPSSDFSMQIERINKSLKASPGPELFEKLYGPDTVKTEEEFLDRIRQEIAEGYRYESEHQLRHELEDFLLHESRIDLPHDFLKRWLKHSNEKISDEQLEKEYGSYARDLKWRLIESRIFKEQGMEITKEEVESFARNLIVDQYVRYGQAHLLTEDKLGEMALRYLQNQDSLQRAVESLTSRKVFEYLNSIIQTNVSMISHDEFIRLMSEHKHTH